MPLAEFSYNNSYQASIQMAPFEALYGRRCRTPLNWSTSGERNYFGPDMVVEMEDKVKQIQANLKAAQDRKVMPIRDDNHLPLRLGIFYT